MLIFCPLISPYEVAISNACGFSAGIGSPFSSSCLCVWILKEKTIDEIFGVAGRPRDRYLQRKKELSNQKNDKVTNYHDLLRYYQYAIAKVPRHKREKATNAQAMHNRYGQEIWDVLKASYSDRELSDTPSPKFIDAANELIIAFRGESGNYRDKIHQPFYDMYQGDENESIDELI